MDGDMYESTMDQLFNLYSKLQSGGVLIVDDYIIKECNQAIHDFRRWHNITEEITTIPGDRTARYWIKKKWVDIQMYRYKSLLGPMK
jgi:O-methyltransferase